MTRVTVSDASRFASPSSARAFVLGELNDSNSIGPFLEHVSVNVQGNDLVVDLFVMADSQEVADAIGRLCGTHLRLRIDASA